jgi:hypothetical protein
MKVLVVSDIHGRHETLRNAFDKFLSGGADKILLLGDLADSYTRSNEDIMRCYKMAFDMKELLGDKVILLLGNHELHYMYPLDGYMCSGYRPDLAAQLEHYIQDHRKHYLVAYQVKNYLFTHAGVQKKWLAKYESRLIKYAELIGKDISHKEDLADILNAVNESGDRWILHEIGTKRGGLRYDYGGPTWCDRDELMSYGPVPGYHQIVGHTPQGFVNKQTKFEGDKHYNNTSVIFCDVYKDEKPSETFLMIEISENES